MSGKQYFRNQLPIILLHIAGILVLNLFLLAVGNNIQTVLFISVIWVLVLVCFLSIAFLFRKQKMERLLSMTEQLEERYLIAEIMKKPVRADDQVFYQILKLAEKSMLERIETVQRERKEYREYIEQWIHEIKTPITAMKLLCENNRSDFTRSMLVELEAVNSFTEQALYYAKIEHAEKDYSIKEVLISDIIHNAVADNKYLLRENQVRITIEENANTVYTDEKWIRFILNQLISNSVKYRSDRPELVFSVSKKSGQTLLSVSDNGIGISEADIPRIFEKGFTGKNGRRVSNSTGIGLYLCWRLCDKLGIGLTAYSDGNGATFVLSFPLNDYIAGTHS